MNAAPIVRDVVLVGGGHSHALLIRRWAMRPLAGVRLTLVSDGVLTPYSGMLPGLVAGHYTSGEVHIDLLRLCTWAGVRFIDARMVGLDTQARRIQLDGRPAIGYDRLSLDTGSTPDLSVPGAAEHSTPVKPVAGFMQRWHAILDRLPASKPADSHERSDERRDGRRLHIGVVGSGAGGFEIVMALDHALAGRAVMLHWMLRGTLPLGGRNGATRGRALAAAKRAGIQVHTGFDVVRVDAGPMLHATDGRRQPLDELLWCTGAIGPHWPRAAGLHTDARGFVLTDAMLRSVSHPEVYATGDIGTQRDTPSAKAGVHAVRQAPVLHHNLRADLLGEALRAYRPQRDFLSLMATGARHAIASRGRLAVAGAWVWRWKDWIDRRFMQRFEQLPTMALPTLPAVLPTALRTQAGSTVSAPDGMRCRGCGAKVGDSVLREALQAYRDDDPDGECGVMLGIGEARDVCVVAPEGRLLVQSVDQLSALFDDPWRFARIATRHALGDVLTVRARPHSALLTLTLPPAEDVVQRRELSMLLDGVGSVLREQGVRLIGGHTAEGPQLQICLAFNAFADPTDLDARGRKPPQAGDVVILTRAIGTGVLFAGSMRALARGVDLAAAIDTMDRSQFAVAHCLHGHGARCVTDVTGFGLAGHLRGMLAGRNAAVRVNMNDVPLLEGARSLAQQGIRSSLFEANHAAVLQLQGGAELSDADATLLADPQTAGGFLAVMPAEQAEATLSALRPLAPRACAIGTIVSATGPSVVIPA